MSGIINQKMKLVLTVTGGGTAIFDRLLSVGGASSYFLEGHIPYNQNSLKDYLGFEPDKAVSPLTARQMAMAAFKRAIELGADPSEATGIACTCALAKADERDGREHRVYIAKQTQSQTLCLSYLLTNTRTRQQEEQYVAYLLEELVCNDAVFGYTKMEIGYDWYKTLPVIIGKMNCRVIASSSNLLDKKPIIYAGSFNPYHKGHNEVVKWCNKHLECKPYLEISIHNADKPPLDFLDIEHRVDSIKAFTPDISGIIFTDASRFYEKSWQYLSPSFIVGSDTFNRIFDSKYYSDPQELDSAIEHFKVNDTKFYVLDRKGYEVHNHLVDRLGLDRLVRFVPKSEYQDVDGISSTKLRSVCNE